MARKPKTPAMPAFPAMGAPGTAMTSSSVKNVSNSGQMSTSTQTTGATGNVINNNTIRATPGSDGAPGTSTPPPTISDIPGTISDPAGNITITPGQSDSFKSAYATAEGHLAQARQQALAAVPAQYRDQVNASFDTASSQLAEQKKRLGY